MTIEAHRVENLHESLLISLIKVIIISHKYKLKNWIFMQENFSSLISIKVPSSIKVLKSGNQKIAGGLMFNIVHKKHKLMTKTFDKELRKGIEKKFSTVVKMI